MSAHNRPKSMCKRCHKNPPSHGSSICMECLPAVEAERRDKKIAQMAVWRAKYRPGSKPRVESPDEQK